MQPDKDVVFQPDAALGSAALARVIAEVRHGQVRSQPGAYNRTYNRHNR
jgi:hypothetical protein